MARRKKITLAGTADNPQSSEPLITADGNFPSIREHVDFEGGKASWFISGTFGSGTAKLQTMSPDGITWHDIPSMSATANAMLNFEAPAGRLRINLASSTDPELSSWVVGIPNNAGG